MTKKKSVLLASLIFVFAFVFTLMFYEFALDISGTYKVTTGDKGKSRSDEKKQTIYIGVISRYPPNILYRGYQPLLDYLTSKTNYKFELKLSNDYGEAVRTLIEGGTSAAFLGSYVYVEARKQYGVIPLLKPLNENYEPYSRAVLVTHRSTGIYKIKDLKGKKLALPSKESFSSNWFLRYELQKYTLSKTDFASLVHFPHHQSVIYQVINGYFDAGVTRELLIKNLPNRDLIRVISYSDPIPSSPLVAAPDCDKQLVDAIKNTLKALNGKNPKTAEITKDWDKEFIYGFEEAKDSDYDYIRIIGE